MNINFSKFHKIECDDNCTTLEHPSGHTIKIAHKSLSDNARKELDAIPLKMAKGGYAKYSQKYDPNHGAKASKASNASKSVPQAYTPPKNAKDAYTEPDHAGAVPPRDALKNETHEEKYSPGEDAILNALNRSGPPLGPKGPSQHYPPCINPSCKSYGHPHPNCRCYGGFHEAGNFADGGEVSSYCSDNRQHKEVCEYFKEGGMAEGEAPSEAPVPQQMSANLGPQDAPQEQPKQQDVPVGSPEAPTQNAQPEKPASQVDQFQESKQQHLQDLGQEAQMFQSDLNAGHIKPETYHDLFAKKDTLGKIGTMFGLLLGGAGSGLTGQPNALLGMMNNEITNDLDAQQKSASNQQNFLKINQQNLMNQAQAKNIKAEADTRAYALSKVQMNYAALHKLVQDTQKLPPGPQKDQAMQTLAMMNQAVQSENFNVLDRAATGAAFYQTMFGNQGSGEMPEQQFQQKVQKMKTLGPQAEKIATDLEEKHYPGIPGQASAPLSGDDRVQIHSGVAFDRSLNNFRQWAKTHSGDLSPSDINYGHALAADLQGAYRQATHGGVYKEGEQNFISGIIDETPTKFFNKVRVIPKLDAAADANKQRLDQLLKDKGFHGYPGMQNKQEAETKSMHGSQYKKVDGGWQKVK